MKQVIEFLPYGLLVIWTIFSINYLRRAKRTPNEINPYIYMTMGLVFLIFVMILAILILLILMIRNKESLNKII
jgi:L-asparagine transporter-like permease